MPMATTLLTTWRSDVYNVLSMCHVHIEVRIEVLDIREFVMLFLILQFFSHRQL
jgi:hypothetical protein